MARLGRWIAGGLLVVLVAAVVGWRLAAPAAPDAFYRKALPAAAKPGDLLAAEPFTRNVPSGARAWRILYATTRADGSPAAASGVVMARAGLGEAAGVVAWAHGTTGIVAGCAPSVLPNAFGYVPALPALLAENWVYVATDYAGLGTEGGHAYLVGEDAARGVLDAVRAARRLPEAPKAARVVVWGHSQGGGSALWTALRASHAPDVALVGAAALAPAGDLPGLLAAVRDTAFGRIISAYALVAYARVYPDVGFSDYAMPGVGWLIRDMASRCIVGWPTLASIVQSHLIAPFGVFARDPAAGALGRRMVENTPRGAFPIPLFVAQGDADDLVPPSVQRRYVSGLCEAGATIRYRAYAGRDHLSLVMPGSPLDSDLLAWTRGRFAAVAAPNDCPIPAR